jgi:2Fe-2S ferredoxin
MIRISFIRPDGAAKTIEARGGMTLMETAVQNHIDGIEAECGGACSCATCHIYVDPAWFGRVGTPGEFEEALLAETPERRPTSRLSCQIKVTDQLDGLIVATPASQG